MEKEIKLDIELNYIKPEEIIDALYIQNIIGNNFEKTKFDEITNIFEYLQPYNKEWFVYIAKRYWLDELDFTIDKYHMKDLYAYKLKK